MLRTNELILAKNNDIFMIEKKKKHYQNITTKNK